MRIQKFLSEGVQLCQRFIFILFIVDEGREDPNTTISGSSLVRQRNAISMAFRLHADDGPTSKAGLVSL